MSYVVNYCCTAVHISGTNANSFAIDRDLRLECSRCNRHEHASVCTLPVRSGQLLFGYVRDRLCAERCALCLIYHGGVFILYHHSPGGFWCFPSRTPAPAGKASTMPTGAFCWSAAGASWSWRCCCGGTAAVPVFVQTEQRVQAAAQMCGVIKLLDVVPRFVQ